MNHRNNLYGNAGLEITYYLWYYCPMCGYKYDSIDCFSKEDLKKQLKLIRLWDGLCGDCEQELFGKIETIEET